MFCSNFNITRRSLTELVKFYLLVSEAKNCKRSGLVLKSHNESEIKDSFYLLAEVVVCNTLLYLFYNAEQMDIQKFNDCLETGAIWRKLFPQ